MKKTKPAKFTSQPKAKTRAKIYHLRLPEPIEQWVEEQVETKGYKSGAAVITERMREQWEQERSLAKAA